MSINDVCVDYAIYQRCFHRLRVRSNACYSDFRSRADQLVNRISLPSNAVSDFTRQTAIQQYCRYVILLYSCFRIGYLGHGIGPQPQGQLGDKQIVGLASSHLQ